MCYKRIKLIKKLISISFLLFFLAPLSTLECAFKYRSLWPTSNDVISRQYGGKGFEQGIKIVEDNGYIFSGNTYKSDTNSMDFIVGKLDYLGTPLWAVTLGGTNSDILENMIELKNKDIMLLGSSCSLFRTFLRVIGSSRPPRPLIVRLGEEGAVKWAREFNEHRLHDLCEDNAGRIVLIGQTYSELEKLKKENFKALITTLSDKGDVIWAKTIALNNYQYLNANRVVKIDNQFVLLLQIAPDETSRQSGFGLVTMDMEGNIQKKLFFATQDHKDLYIRNILKTRDNNWLLIGQVQSLSEENDLDICLIKIDNTGTVVWSKILGILGHDQGMGIVKFREKYVAAVVSSMEKNQPPSTVYFLLNELGHIEEYYRNPAKYENGINSFVEGSQGIIGFGFFIADNKNLFDQDLFFQILKSPIMFKPKEVGFPFVEKKLELELLNTQLTLETINCDSWGIKTIVPNPVKYEALFPQ